MLKRLFVGLFLGTIVGAVLAAILVQGLGVMSWEGSFLGKAGAYLAAAFTGVVTGLIAGKPIWSADGKVEAGLKAFFGSLIALGGMFVLRTWVHVPVDLSAIKASVGPADVGELPALSLPIIAAVLAAFFELDNNEKGEKKDEEKAATGGTRVRVTEASDTAADEVDDQEQEEEPAAKKKR
jgi:hypothetical protein